MNIEIIELKKSDIERYNVKEFLFDMVKKCYDLDYVPEYHYDIVELEKYYIDPEKCNFFIAIDTDEDKVVATSAIRSYDRDYNVKNRTYSREHTASFHRVFVHPDYRHCKIGSELVEKLENFCIEKHYNEIYLHTSEKSYGALSFWQYNNFEITYDTHDDAGTIHMEKVLV
ncbi:MAG: GNAT family N-acetyltransferase [Methanosphaera sp.]|uniref:GNAT family N-acetyltransferase n=1 Tax=Methanosphaera sp. TaxID=2666342 RepID=UPI0025FC0D4D|nr:GNAT family N-acetyltransferase [Methanosphaera sp.]MCI5866957.1 GNAT family N-acetyltransferase [Methanosphaera sp.]MDD6533900.1 GNAT family N-acetyltransferase [Methanosphaera sp.]MDY3956290.1 GNAT family N-acetyltransferase [Methanosphaera sp.]